MEKYPHTPSLKLMMPKAMMRPKAKLWPKAEMRPKADNGK
jgi:hypothetical protein